ncbi:MAG: ParB/RepB/Spo0J family partition protein [Chloroflexi bacterium]|nr:ParB/RepB/Spo0J family partition protein [Chloroflexota bacterium]MBV9596384.1 ParB/RepB/Spo0J family partition protein [Chloroflexota bacterium]
MTISQAPSVATRLVASLRPNPLNPRGDVDASGLDELAESISTQGVLQPLLVTPDGVVVAGHRRLAAARMACLEEVPVVVRDLDPVQQQEIMLVENLQRQELSPVEEARAYRRLLEGGHTLAQLARRIGAPAARINARLVLLKLDDQVQWMFHRGDLPLTLAPVLAKLADPILSGRSRPELLAVSSPCPTSNGSWSVVPAHSRLCRRPALCRRTNRKRLDSARAAWSRSMAWPSMPADPCLFTNSRTCSRRPAVPVVRRTSPRIARRAPCSI